MVETLDLIETKLNTPVFDRFLEDFSKSFIKILWRIRIGRPCQSTNSSIYRIDHKVISIRNNNPPTPKTCKLSRINQNIKLINVRRKNCISNAVFFFPSLC